MKKLIIMLLVTINSVQAYSPVDRLINQYDQYESRVVRLNMMQARVLPYRERAANRGDHVSYLEIENRLRDIDTRRESMIQEMQILRSEIVNMGDLYE